MKLQEFLQAVLPDEGVRVVAKKCVGQKNGKEFTYFKHVPANTHEEMRTAIRNIIQTEQTDVYYALATFKQGFHPKPKAPDKTQIRVRDNVYKLKSLWFDIDFKDGLSDHTQVVAAMRDFSNRTKMPMPSIFVHSGNGIHVYWPLKEAICFSDWQPVAERLKAVASELALAADLACTADSCRVLRPVGTVNFKDPDNRKIVKGVTSGRLFDLAELSTPLFGFSGEGAGGVVVGNGLGSPDGLGAVPAHLHGVDASATTALTRTNAGRSKVESFFSTITEGCAVAKHALTTKGSDASEPEWTAVLQLLKHCKDGELFVHEVSSGHIDYEAGATTEKYQQRLENESGPTLCATFEGYRPEVCKSCPMYRKIKSPIALGEEKVETATGKVFPLSTWRPIPGHMGMERKLFDPPSGQYFWEKQLDRSWELESTALAVNDNMYGVQITARLGKSIPIRFQMPGYMLGVPNELKKVLAGYGVPLRARELNPWTDLMNTWLQKIQQERQVDNAVDKLGWIQDGDEENPKDIGFTAGTTSYYTDGSKQVGLRAADEFLEIAKHYKPRGNLDIWRKVANFICEQNNPAFTAILASAFAVPIFRFTGMPGATLTIMSTESGVGKSSVMKLAQGVWGSPTNGINSTTDTYLSVMRKAAFLQNLPIYWDEIRGPKSLENFYNAAFDIAQGKERTRLDSSAKMREINTWQTMAIGASNESIFDFMATQQRNSDAGTARTFEIVVNPFHDPARAAHQAMFGALDSNFGRAGQLYAAHLTTNRGRISEGVQHAYEGLYREWGMCEGERFWAAICACLLVGAGTANLCGLTKINMPTLKTFLHDNVIRLRIQTKSAMFGASPRELVIGYLQAHQDGQMVVDKFPSPGSNSPSVVTSPPNSRLMIVRAGDVVRIRKQDFNDWLRKSKEMTFSSVEKHMRNDLDMQILNTKLAVGTKWELPRSRCLELTFEDQINV